MPKNSIYEVQAGTVCSFLLQTLKEELDESRRRNFERLRRLLSHQAIVEMVSALFRQTAQTFPAVANNLGTPYKRGSEALGSVDQGLSEIATSLELVTQLRRVDEILRDTFQAIVDDSLNADECSTLAVLSYGRMLETLGYKGANIRRSLALKARCQAALQE